MYQNRYHITFINIFSSLPGTFDLNGLAADWLAEFEYLLKFSQGIEVKQN